MASTFARDISNFSKKIQLAVPTVTRVVAMEMYKRIIKRTPVDTGRARANWMITLDSPASGIQDATDRQGSKTMASGMTQVAGYKDGSIWITNNLPYIRPLEYGHSKQAPNGMVRITVMEFQSIVKRAFKAVLEGKE